MTKKFAKKDEWGGAYINQYGQPIKQTSQVDQACLQKMIQMGGTHLRDSYMGFTFMLNGVKLYFKYFEGSIYIKEVQKTIKVWENWRQLLSECFEEK